MKTIKQIPIGSSSDQVVHVFDLEKSNSLNIAGASQPEKLALLKKIVKFITDNFSSKDIQLVISSKDNFTEYEKSEYLFKPIIRTVDDDKATLKELADEIDNRYKLLQKSDAKSIYDYLEKTGKQLPYILYISDDVSDAIYKPECRFYLKPLERILTIGILANIGAILISPDELKHNKYAFILLNVLNIVVFKTDDYGFYPSWGDFPNKMPTKLSEFIYKAYNEDTYSLITDK